jgi:hypothetical protein
VNPNQELSKGGKRVEGGGWMCKSFDVLTPWWPGEMKR